jgi:hypothetical protein
MSRRSPEETRLLREIDVVAGNLCRAMEYMSPLAWLALRQAATEKGISLNAEQMHEYVQQIEKAARTLIAEDLIARAKARSARKKAPE